MFHHDATKPSLTNVAFTVPISGGVRNALSKPTGNWSTDINTMRWKLGEVQPVDEQGNGHVHVVKSTCI